MPRSENFVQTLGPLGWAIAVAVLVLVCAAIVLVIVAIRYLLLRMPEAGVAQRRTPGLQSRTRYGTAQSAPGQSAGGRYAPASRFPQTSGQPISPVPPENPHSPPTPPVGTRPNRS